LYITQFLNVVMTLWRIRLQPPVQASFTDFTLSLDSRSRSIPSSLYGARLDMYYILYYSERFSLDVAGGIYHGECGEEGGVENRQEL